MTDRNQRMLLISSLIVLTLVATGIDSYYFLLFTSAVSVCVFLFLIYRLLQLGQLSRFLLLSSLACGAWLSVAFVQSYLSFRDSEISAESFSGLFSSTSILISPSLYSLAYSYALAFILGVCIVSDLAWLQRQEYKFTNVLRYYFSKAPINFYRLALFLISILLTYFSASGFFAVRGLDDKYFSDSGILPWWFVAVDQLLASLPLLIVLMLRKITFRVAIIDVILLVYSFFIGAYFYLLKGRFGFLSYFVIIAGSALFLSRSKIVFTKLLITKLVIVIILVISLANFVQSIFDYINILRYQAGVSTTPLEILSDYIAFVASPTEVSYAAIKSSENLGSRTLVLWPLASSIQMWLNHSHNGLIGFSDLVNSFLNALPRFLFPFKGELVLQENLLYGRFPFSTVDTADSPYLYAFASFGLAGIAIYPIAIFFFYSIALSLSIKVGKSNLALWLKLLFLAFATSQFLSFSLLSYGELATTGLIRTFFVIIMLSLSAVSWSWVTQTRQPLR